MNNLIIYVDDRKVENNETKYRCLVKTEKETLEVYLTQKSIDKLKQSHQTL